MMQKKTCNSNNEYNPRRDKMAKETSSPVGIRMQVTEKNFKN